MHPITRSPMPLDSLSGRDSAMETVLQAWRRARRERGGLPARADLPVDGLLDRLDFTGWLHVATQSPARFRFAADGEIDPSPLSGLGAVADHGDDLRAVARHLYDDLAAVAFTGSATLHRIARPAEPGFPPIVRLILPLSEDGRRVDGLLVCGVAQGASTTVH